MGLMGALGGLGAAIESSAGYALRSTMDELKQQRIAESASKMRLDEDLVRRDRDVAGAATERARIDVEAQAAADKRGGGLMTSARDQYAKSGMSPEDISAGLGAVDAAEAAGSYKQTPTIQDKLMAKGDLSAVAADERAQRAEAHQSARDTVGDARHDKERAEDVKFKEAELKLRQASEGRLSKSAEIDSAIKQISLDNAKQVQVLRTEFKDATPERKAKINEEIQLITGKDNDKFLPVPIKDAMGNVSGYQIFDTKGGRFVSQDATGGSAERRTDAAGNIYERGPDGKPKLVSSAGAKDSQKTAKKDEAPTEGGATGLVASAKSDPATRIAEIEAKLQASNSITMNMDDPLYKQLRGRLAPAERRRLELELENLKGNK